VIADVHVCKDVKLLSVRNDTKLDNYYMEVLPVLQEIVLLGNAGIPCM